MSKDKRTDEPQKKRKRTNERKSEEKKKEKWTSASRECEPLMSALWSSICGERRFIVSRHLHNDKCRFVDEATTRRSPKRMTRNRETKKNGWCVRNHFNYSANRRTNNKRQTGKKSRMKQQFHFVSFWYHWHARWCSVNCRVRWQRIDNCNACAQHFTKNLQVEWNEFWFSVHRVACMKEFLKIFETNLCIGNWQISWQVTFVQSQWIDYHQ